MTFTVLGLCPRTRKLGFCQASSTPAIGWRCADVVPGRGVVTVQAHADPRVLRLACDLMDAGHSPQQVLAELAREDAHAEYRQIAVLDRDGGTAVRTGRHAGPWAGEIVGEGFVVTGSVLAGEHVLRAMAHAFEASAPNDLEDRLLLAVEAGRDAGGQPRGQTSCALTVHAQHALPIVNLRVDLAPEPIGEMRHLFDWYRPRIPGDLARTLDPRAPALPAMPVHTTRPSAYRPG